MIPIRVLWSVNFFFFALVLLFVWSKAYIVSKKIQAVVAAVAAIEGAAQELQPGEEPEAEEETEEA
jgi:hypothetical protein